MAEAEAEAAVARNLTLHPLLRGGCACAWWVGEVRWAPTQLNFGLRDLCPSYEPVPPGEWTDGEGRRERDERERERASTTVAREQSSVAEPRRT